MSEPEIAEVVPEVPSFIDAGKMDRARDTRSIGFGRITHTDNPRTVLQQLNKEENGSLQLVNTRDTDRSILHIVRHPDLNVVHNFLVKFYQLEMNRENPDECPINLAESLSLRQIQPVAVRRIGGHSGEEANYSLIAGGRRTLSTSFLYAMSRVAHSGQEWVFPPDIRKFATSFLEKLAQEKKVREPAIECQIQDVNATQAFDLAVRENKSRKAFTALEDAEIYETYLNMKDPKTGEKFNLRTLAQYLGEDYQHLRGRHALSLLTDREKESLSNNPKRLTHFIAVALARKTGSKEPEKADNGKKRHNACTMAEMQKLFDESRRNDDRMEAIADCMKMDISDAIEASDDRLRAAGTPTTGRRGRPKGSKNK